MIPAGQVGRDRARDDRAREDLAGAPPRPILVARPTGRGESLSQQLAADGFVVEHRPFIELVLVGREGPSAADRPADADRAAEADRPTDVGRAADVGRADGTHRGDAADAAARADLFRDLTDLAAGVFTHVVVTSRTTVEALLAATSSTSALIVPPSTRVIAVGEGTAAALAEAGMPAHVVAGGSGAALVEEMDAPVGESLVWFPASAAASSTVPDGLEAKGYRVRQTIAYRPQVLDQPIEVTEGLPTGRYGALVLTSPMIARLAAQFGVHPTTPVVSIGGPTSAGARNAGLTVTVQADSTDDAALARAVRQVVLHPVPSSPD